MKNLILLLVVSTFQVTASVYSQEANITLELKNASFETVVRQLEKTTEYRFLYDDSHVAQIQDLTLRFADAEIGVILEACLKGTPYTYKLVNQTVVIVPRVAEATAPQTAMRTITGKTTDASGAPVPGVTIVLKGTTLGTSSDAQGNFSLTVPRSETTVLLFTFVGMKSQEVTVTDDKPLQVKMEDDQEEISEVVVTGYYNMSKESYTGASRTITSTELRSAGNQNILTSLKNLDPSFMMVQNNVAGSNPNVLPEFQIRGQSSLASIRDEYTSNPNMPLFILDGFEVTSEKIFDMDIYRVNSITILKDAAATAIYGSRAANGVVVITTVAPKSGRLYVTYNADLTLAAADLTGYDLLNAAEKLEFEKKVGIYSVYDGDESNMYYKTKLDDLYNSRLRNVESGYDTYWLNKPIDKVSVSHKHTLRIDGGSENFRYAIDASYNNQKGVMKKSGRTREGLGMSFQYLVGKFRLSNEITYSSTQAKESPYGNFSTYAGLNPYFRYKDDKGDYLYMLDDDDRGSQYYLIQYNPLYNTTLNTRNDSKYDEFQDKLNVIWNVLPGWVIRGNLSITKQNNSSVVFKPAKHTDFAAWNGEDYDRRGYYQSRNGETKTFETQIMTSFQKGIEEHMFTFNGAWEMNDKTNSWEQIVAEGFPNDNLDDLGSALQYRKDGVPTSYEGHSRMAAVFGSLNYIFDERYILDATIRYDASSVFGSDKRWAPFWSAGAGWNLHKERFLQDKSFVNRLKIRGSYGLTGSVNYSPYQSMTTYKYLTGTRYHFGQGAALMALGNPGLGWQKVHQFNVGLDFDAWDNRLQLMANYYVKLSKDALTDITLAPSTGFSNYKANLGEIENKGWDISLRVDPIKDSERGIVLNVFGTAAGNKNILKKLSNSLKAYNDQSDDFLDGKPGSGTETTEGKRNFPRVRYIEGASINSIWVNKSLGIDAASGLEIFETAAGGTTTEWSSDNYIIGGCTDPKMSGTFGFNFQYQRLRVNASFYYSYGGDMYNQTLVDKVQDADFRYNVDRRALTDRWFQPGDISKYETVTDAARLNSGKRTKPTSRFIERENYLELSTINASYEFNPEWLEKIGFSQLRATFYMNDVFRASSVKIERGTNYPFARNFSLGIQARF